MTFDEITYIENKDFDYDKISLQDFEKKLIVKKRILKSKGYIDEKLEYIVIKNRDEVRDNLPCLILLHGLRDCAEDWLGRGRIRENYLTLLKENKIDKMNIILLNSGYEGMGWYTNFYNDKSHQYENCIIKEIIPQLKEEFPHSQFGIAGFSMGGYGAFKLGLIHLNLFKVVGSFSYSKTIYLNYFSVYSSFYNRYIISTLYYYYLFYYFFHYTFLIFSSKYTKKFFKSLATYSQV